MLRQKTLECVDQKSHIKQLEDMIESLSQHLDAADKRVDHCEGILWEGWVLTSLVTRPLNTTSYSIPPLTPHQHHT